MGPTWSPYVCPHVAHLPTYVHISHLDPIWVPDGRAGWVVTSSTRSPLSGCLYRDVTWGTESLAPFKYSGIWLNFTGA